jgi:hypothetical protein
MCFNPVSEFDPWYLWFIRYIVVGFVWLIDYLPFYVPLKNFSLVWNMQESVRVEHEMKCQKCVFLELFRKINFLLNLVKVRFLKIVHRVYTFYALCNIIRQLSQSDLKVISLSCNRFLQVHIRQVWIIYIYLSTKIWQFLYNKEFKIQCYTVITYANIWFKRVQQAKQKQASDSDPWSPCIVYSYLAFRSFLNSS